MCLLDMGAGVKVTRLRDGPGKYDFRPEPAEEDLCSELFKGYQIERYKNGKVGKHFDISFGFVLHQMQLFLTTHLNPVERDRFGVIGFNRLGRTFLPTKNAFARACVHKVVILNLDALQEHDYKERVWSMEDIDFDLRVKCAPLTLSAKLPAKF